MKRKSAYAFSVCGLAFILALMSGIWSGLPLEASAGAAPAHLPQQKLLNLRRLTSGDYPDDSYKKGEVVVTLDDPSQGNLQKLLADFPDLIDDTPGGVVAAAEDSGRPAAVRLRLSQGTDELQAAAQLLRSPLVKLAEPNIIFQADTINPNDYRYSQQWNLGDSNGIRADQAWDLQKGSAALTLAVIDTGVDYNHEDLRDRCVGGYDFYNGDSDPWDDNGHGTSVSGIACASTNNHIGMAGIDWNAKIMPLKALGSNGEGGLDGVVNALYWAGQHSADVINMSFTSPTYSAELEDAIEYAHSRGCVMVAAAGNEGTSRIDYPAGLTYVIGVGSTGPTGVRSSFSNYNSSVDLVAPGETILGPYPGNRYLTGSGTSEASPHVAGAALLVKAEYPGSGPDEIWRRLKDGARPGGAGYDEQYGWGLLDAEASLKVPLVGITSPSDFSYPASGMVSAIATDTPVNVQYGELWVDGQLCDSASVAPGPSVSFTFSAWDLNQLGEGTHTITVRARDSGSQWRGEQSITVYRNHSQPRPAHDWYLAEGTTSWGFEEYVLVQNPNSAPAQVHVRFMKPGGSTQDCDFSMMPASRLTINVNSLVPSGDVSTYVHSSDQEIIAERSMYWGNRTGGHDAAGVNNPGTDWYMAEGSTNWGFEEYVLVQNPNAVGASIHVTFMEQGGTTREFDFAMAGCSRLTLPVNDLVPGSDIATHVHSDQPVIAERSMYWNNRDGGHCATAVSEGSRTWYLAEGSTAWNFEEYLLVQNPNSTAANVDFDFMKPSGSEVHKSFSLAPFSRFTLNVAQAVPGSDVSAFVSADQPVIAERAMYWPKGSRSRAEGHDSTGSVSAATTWYLAEGSTAWGFDEWILLLNPTDDVAHAVLDYMRTDGSSVVQQVKVVAHARYTVHCNDFDPNRDVSVRLTSDFPLVVERSMYWQDKEGGTNALGVLQP